MRLPGRTIIACLLLAAGAAASACTGPEGGDPRVGTYHGWFSLGNTSTGSTTLTVLEDGSAQLECTYTGSDPQQGTFHLRLAGEPHIDRHGSLTGNDLTLTRIVPGVDTTSAEAAIYGDFHVGLDYFNGEWQVMPGEPVSGAGFWFASRDYRP